METVNRSQTKSQGQVLIKTHHNHGTDQTGNDLRLVSNSSHRDSGKGSFAKVLILSCSKERYTQNNVDQHAGPLGNGAADGQAESNEMAQHLRSEKQAANAAQQRSRDVDILEQFNIFTQKNTQE